MGRVEIERFKLVNVPQLRALHDIVSMNSCIRNALISGAFIAGGLPRFALAARHAPPLTDALLAYFRRIGDIDLFFRDGKMFSDACEIFRYNDRHFEQSITGNACNTNVFFQNLRAKTQLIGMQFGEPADILEQFDLRNSMVAIDDTYAYIEKDWCDLQEKNLIEITEFNSAKTASTVWRVCKYMGQYHYDGLVEESRIRMLDWILDNRRILKDPQWGKSFMNNIFMITQDDRLARLDDILLLQPLTGEFAGLELERRKKDGPRLWSPLKCLAQDDSAIIDRYADAFNAFSH